MAVKLRLKRIGKKHDPFYRVIATDGRKSTSSGEYLEVVGTYNPKAKPALINLDMTKIQDWISKGAQPSATVARLMKKVK